MPWQYTPFLPAPCTDCGRDTSTRRPKPGRLYRCAACYFALRKARAASAAVHRFWALADVRGPDECWWWTASRRSTGYGQVSWRSRPRPAHQVAFFLAHGRWARPCCLHRCDNRLCVNPAHLFEGTVGDNNRDMTAKGRNVALATPERMGRGSRQGHALLTEDAVSVIRARLLAGESGASIAADYAVTRYTISDIKRRKSWRHVP